MPDDLDSIVKGAPAGPQAAKSQSAGTTPIQPVAGKQGDPLNHTPSSPSMIYLNLLILEASLRAQYLELRARRRHHTFFLILLTGWVAFWGYQLYFAPREDGKGLGGSIYWAVEGLQKVCFMGGIVTAVLVWATGIWERGIRWPRRWFAISNRGLRGFNCKLVIIRRPWWAEMFSTVGFFLTYGLFTKTASSSYRHVEPALLRQVEKELQMTSDGHPTLILPAEDEERGGHEEDLAPSGDYVKLLLLAKPFSPTFRENWEVYRTEYWERENERRALLRQKVAENDGKIAKKHYGWLYWLPWARSRSLRAEAKSRSGHHHGHPHQHQHHHRQASSTEKEHKRRVSGARRGSHSSSRSTTPILDLDDAHASSKKTNASSTGTEKRRKKAAAGGAKSRRAGTDSRSVTPEIPSPLARESSVASESGGEDGGRTLRSSAARRRSGSVRELKKVEGGN